MVRKIAKGKKKGEAGSQSERHRKSARKSGKGKRKKKGKRRDGGGADSSLPESSPQSQAQVVLDETQASAGKVSLDIIAEITEYEASRVRMPTVPTRLALSRQISRFQLPMDIKTLETLSPQDYLMKYCIVCKRRQVHYKKSFDKFDKDRDGILSFQEMEKALIDVYFNTITSRDVRRVTELLLADESTRFTHKLFIPLCALSERLLYTMFEPEDREDNEYREKPTVEEADVWGLNWKFQGCEISDDVKRLISVL
ncbi:uncharacterized protein LOC103180571 [Callorhinchus milii]|uniref:uncharacterized protein LOC103180571 n=1 Tax=Callorhinchus milii TaxID=7868 RepID=UPI00045734DB|nr:uncharacterized protein LOC103180571 [Callorhinchus milii]|eukprot:gi/632957828/ref/XP_007894697.1/ PREDICTED: uncharacterized protein LOC103180571 [Callorhinchus milii]